ncbi:MAG: DUF177 domain-containing protein [Nitrospirae bacterium]|nr:DUF177 domain-containing protein [Nitrospirota bacterium]
MKILVSDIPSEGLEKEFDIPISLEEGGIEKAVHVSMRVMKYGASVVVEGHAGMTATLSCSRCLEDFPYSMEVDFTDEYVPDTEIARASEHELGSDELDIGYYSNDEIDVKELIKEQMLLQVPIKLLCKPDCRGLCPKCGKDLNTGSCTCREEEVDPRLAKLSELKNRLK